jgi:group I intron endonuclease
MDLFKPEYNICKEPAAPMLGRNHSEQTRAKLSALKGENNPMFGYIKTHSEETKEKLSVSKMGNSNGKNQPNSIKIQVTDLETGISTVYNSIRETARALNIFNNSIYKNMKSKSQKPYKGRYIFVYKKID